MFQYTPVNDAVFYGCKLRDGYSTRDDGYSIKD
jgi:hypothetical protein